jgi:hypothetical protein
MRRHIEGAMRAAFTLEEAAEMVRASGLERVRLDTTDGQLTMERTGESDPNSWIKAREQYL